MAFEKMAMDQVKYDVAVEHQEKIDLGSQMVLCGAITLTKKWHKLLQNHYRCLQVIKLLRAC